MNTNPNASANSTELTILSGEDIALRVNTTNKFSRAEIVAYKAEIAQARKDKRNRLHGMGRNEQDAAIAGLRQHYGLDKLHDVKVTQRKDGRHVATITLEQPKGHVGVKEMLENLSVDEIAANLGGKVDALLKRLTADKSAVGAVAA